MRVEGVMKPLESYSKFNDILKNMNENKYPINIYGLSDSGRSYIIDGIFNENDKSVVEFIVDPSFLSSNVKKMGNVSYAKKSWNSGVDKVIVYNKFV